MKHFSDLTGLQITMGALTDFFANFKAGDPSKGAVHNEIKRQEQRKIAEAKRKAKRAEKKRRKELLMKLQGIDKDDTPEFTKSSKDACSFDPLALANDPTHAEYSGSLSKGLGRSSYNNQNNKNSSSNNLMSKVKF